MKHHFLKKILTNPLRSSYYYLAIFICMISSVLFLYINQGYRKQQQAVEVQEKAQLIMNDFENNLEEIKKIAIKISLNSNFQPNYLFANKFRDKMLLEDFEYFHDISPIATELFLHYSNHTNIYRSSGNLAHINAFLQQFTDDEAKQLLMSLQSNTEDTQCLLLSDKLIILTPVKLFEKTSDEFATLGIIIPTNNLLKRFELVSGSIDGTISFYYLNQLLFTTSSTVYPDKQNTLRSHTSDGLFHIAYSPTSPKMQIEDILLHISLLLLLLGGALALSYAFSQKVHRTLLAITRKYRNNAPISSNESSYENPLDEIQNTLEQLALRNAESQLLLETKQSLLQKQIISNLIQGEVPSDILAFMSNNSFRFPGPCYYAGCIYFEHSASLSEDYYNRFATMLSDLTSPETNEYIYAIYDRNLKLVNFICSGTESQKPLMIEYIHELADIDGYINFISVGPTYYSLADINTSWLKSNELLHQSKNSDSAVEVPYNTYVPNILSAVTEGDMDLAFQEFESFIRAYDKYNSSFLFLQNMYIDFINDLITHAKTHSVGLDYHTANNAITAKNLSNFSTAAKALIHSFCLQRIQLVNDEKDSIKICIINYIDSHFFKFDFSLEKVASETNTNPTIIRTIVIQETGMQYKDYIVHLRLNYAKKLLLESNLSVNEICTEVGYSNASYFVKLFREKIGLTPSKYRQTYKNEER